jgi:predicted DNA-binding transcriptional regulator YafY
MTPVATIHYTNWKCETGHRKIVPIRIFWGDTHFHPEKQWLLEAFDVDKGEMRTFAMKDIHEWA